MSAPGLAQLSPELREELQGPPWMYSWALAPGVTTAQFAPWLDRIHISRLGMMEKAVRAVVELTGGNATAIDLASNEGWFAHRLLDWGVKRVVGVELRPETVRRATLVRDQLGISEERFEIHQGDVLDLDHQALGGPFDIVLVLGLLYHMERPFDAMRVARKATRYLCVVEGQLTRQGDPIWWGIRDRYLEAEAHFAAVVEEDTETNPLAAGEHVVSLVPNRAAMELMARVAGFQEVEWGRPAAHHHYSYALGDRGLLLARPRAAV